MMVNKNLPTWELNVLKSIVSLLQVDTQGENLKESKMNLMPTKEDSMGTFKTMEVCIANCIHINSSIFLIHYIMRLMTLYFRIQFMVFMKHFTMSLNFLSTLY